VKDHDPALWQALDDAIYHWECEWGTCLLDTQKADLVEDIVAGLRGLGLVTND
jgi:hypothetical protein